MSDSDKGLRYDQDKPMMSLLPAAALVEIAKVLTFGAKKYAANNWAKGKEWSRVESCLLRHYARYKVGERVDPESGLSHLAHLACNALFLLTYEIQGLGVDDRSTELMEKK
jgi:dATP/dGTP diphosphohydrolase